MTGLLPPWARCTGYWYATAAGFGYDLEFLRELGLRAARLGRWYGVPGALTAEGPYWVHQWPEGIWDEALGAMYWMYAAPQGEQAAWDMHQALAMPDHSGPARAFWLDSRPYGSCA